MGTSLLPVSPSLLPFWSSLLPIYCKSTSSLPPVCSSLLPIHFQSTSSLLPVFNQTPPTSKSTFLCQFFSFCELWFWVIYSILVEPLLYQSPSSFFQSTSSLFQSTSNPLPVYFQFSSRLQPTSKSTFLCQSFSFYEVWANNDGFGQYIPFWLNRLKP